MLVADDETTARSRLASALATSFRAGDHPHVPQAPDRDPKGPDGRPLDRDTLATRVADAAIVGPPAKVVDQLGAFCTATAARRLALYQEAVADAALTLASIERFAAEVAPQFAN